MIPKRIVKLLLKKTCVINGADKSGWTALHVASMHNDVDIVKILLSKGALINVKDLSSNTPLTLARLANAKEAASYLRKNGAKEFSSLNLHREAQLFDDHKNLPRIGSNLD